MGQDFRHLTRLARVGRDDTSALCFVVAIPVAALATDPISGHANLAIATF